MGVDAVTSVSGAGLWLTTQPAGPDSPVESHADVKDARKFVHTIDWQPRTDLR